MHRVHRGELQLARATIECGEGADAVIIQSSHPDHVWKVCVMQRTVRFCATPSGQGEL